MGLLSGLSGILGGKAKDLGNKYSGQKDFLEAVCAVVALVAFADGSLEDEERTAAVKVITANKNITSSYSTTDIEQTLEAMFGRAQTFSGKAGLYRELEDIAGKPGHQEKCEDAFLVGLDIAHADGSLEEAEKKALGTIAQKLGVNPRKFDGLF